MFLYYSILQYPLQDFYFDTELKTSSLLKIQFNSYSCIAFFKKPGYHRKVVALMNLIDTFELSRQDSEDARAYSGLKQKHTIFFSVAGSTNVTNNPQLSIPHFLVLR